uniref:Secreted protein n=2 Tax=Mus TaxID=862507 RepID=Q3UJB6_MOUSE|nr:unnamed protein product [Mus musculus]
MQAPPWPPMPSVALHLVSSLLSSVGSPLGSLPLSSCEDFPRVERHMSPVPLSMSSSSGPRCLPQLSPSNMHFLAKSKAWVLFLTC